MSCEIKIKSLDFLKEKGAIGKGRVIQDIDTFNELNDALTLLASEKYGVVSPSNDKLFKSESKYVKNLDGSYRYILRAEPNDKLFDVLQIAVDEYVEIPITKPSKINDIVETPKVITLSDIPKPSFKASYLTDKDILEQDNAIELKVKQEALKKEIDTVNKLINCLWS